MDETQLRLWNRRRVDELKRTAHAFGDGKAYVLLAHGASPADSLQAATELGYPHFSHLWLGYPVYSKHDDREV